MKLTEKPGTTSKIVHIFIQDSSAATGVGLTGLVYNSAGLSAKFIRSGAVGSQVLNLATISVIGTWTSGGFKELDAAGMPGVYELHIPDAVLATGAPQVVVMLKGATNMAPVLLEIQLTVDGAGAGAGMSMKVIEKPGATSRIWHIFIQDSDSKTGAGLTGLVYNSAGLTAYYVRSGAVGSAQWNLATISVIGTWTSGGFKELDATNMPGVYEVHPPDALLAVGAPQVSVLFKGAANMVPSAVEAQLNELLGHVSENSESYAEGLRLIRAAALGKGSGFPGGPAVYRDAADGTDRIIATVDADGNRSAVTVDAS